MDTTLLDTLYKSPDWLAEYNRTIGSSRAAAVCNASPWQTPGDVFDAMSNGAVEPEMTPDMKRGVLLEHVAQMILPINLCGFNSRCGRGKSVLRVLPLH